MAYSESKIYLRTILLDIDIMTDIREVYRPSWGQEFTRLQSYCINNESEIAFIETGACHTVAMCKRNRCYTWGWNDYS